jgi:hypothetical protein
VVNYKNRPHAGLGLVGPIGGIVHSLLYRSNEYGPASTGLLFPSVKKAAREPLLHQEEAV